MANTPTFETVFACKSLFFSRIYFGQKFFQLKLQSKKIESDTSETVSPRSVAFLLIFSEYF